MRLFKFINTFTVAILFWIGMFNLYLALTQAPLYALSTFFFIALALYVDTFEKKPFAVSTLDTTNKDAEWEDTLVYTYSIGFLKLCFFLKTHLFPGKTLYSFTPFNDLPTEAKKKAIIKYYQ